MLGKAAIPNLPFVDPNDRPLRIDTDYFGRPRPDTNPFPGPFELPDGGKLRIRVWPISPFVSVVK